MSGSAGVGAEDWRSTLEERCEEAWAAAGMPARFAGMRLETSPLGKGRRGGIAERMRIPAAPEDEAGWERWERLWLRSWYLWGETGVGKTGLATGYAHQFVDPAYGEPGRVVFWSVPDLLSALRSSYGTHPRRGPDEHATLRRCREADLLVLDDVGAEHISGSGWVEDRLYQVVGRRHAEMRPVVFTSNCSLAELAGRVGERIAWRIVEMCGREGIVRVEGRNLRG